MGPLLIIQLKILLFKAATDCLPLTLLILEKYFTYKETYARMPTIALEQKMVTENDNIFQ